MAPPKKPNGPMVRRMIQLEPDDVERLARVTERLGEGSDASTIRRLIREADAELVLTVQPVPPSPMAWPSGVLMEPWHTSDPSLTLGSVAVSVKPAAAFKPHPKPNAGKTSKGRK